MFQRSIDFSIYSSIKIGTLHTINIIETPQDYFQLLQHSTPQIIGKANNLLISPLAKNLILLSKNFDYIKDYGDSLEVGALTPSGKLFSYAKKHNLKGFEILGELPGSIGGIIKMNAGLKSYEIKSTLLGILSIKYSPILEFTAVENLHLSYRNSEIHTLIFAGIFKKEEGFNKDLVKVLKTMRNNQPKEPSFGSCFKNPPNNYAGFLIESVGLKGKRFGKSKNLYFSPKHANFLINAGYSSFQEAIELINLAKEKVYKSHNILLQEEVKILQ
ncbi:UDP-N-acetylmuramate dehydrogenase [Helicobacter mesocricetorum]|uniref:UDP-N-acetylmuramate dehydrogenase n=1 Tax=Helicobacter mesocricetorum TaxID=87012 RepID=UPI000CF1990C|nr:UDP-N-acetylmuramate dehydrogenase [Helicobacter mesocricetorum]